MRGVYSGGPSVASESANEDVLLSYPVFETMFGSPSIQGMDAVTDFVITFSSRWAEAELTVHETITEGKKVVPSLELSGTQSGTNTRTRHSRQPSSRLGWNQSLHVR
jgi:hypothetical protein